jgi:hypothetical protein
LKRTSLKSGLWALLRPYELIYMKKKKNHKKNTGDGWNGILCTKTIDKKLISENCVFPFFLPIRLLLPCYGHVCIHRTLLRLSLSSSSLHPSQRSSLRSSRRVMSACIVAQGIMHDAYRHGWHDAKQWHDIQSSLKLYVLKPLGCLPSCWCRHLTLSSPVSGLIEMIV